MQAELSGWSWRQGDWTWSGVQVAHGSPLHHCGGQPRSACDRERASTCPASARSHPKRPGLQGSIFSVGQVSDRRNFIVFRSSGETMLIEIWSKDRFRPIWRGVEADSCHVRKGHRANDRECAVSSSSSSTQNQTRTARMATRQHLSNQANQVGVCFVLNECSDDPDTSAYMVGQNVPLPTEPTEQIPLTPTASAAVDIKNTPTFDVRVMDDNDEPWSTEADHRRDWNKTFKSGTYRGMLYRIVLRGYPKQVVSLAKAKSVPTNMREFLSWAHRRYRIDVTAPTVERKTGTLAPAGACPGGCKEFSHEGSNAHSIRLTCKICGTVRREERHPPRQDPAACSHRPSTHAKNILR